MDKDHNLNTKRSFIFRYGKGKGKTVSDSDCFNPHEFAEIYYGRDLPHWDQDGKIQFVTFRLADSLPKEKLNEFKELIKEWKEKNPLPYNEVQKLEYEEFLERLEDWLDKGHGQCILADKQIQDIVESSLLHFDGIRYDLYEYVIMPNHVHMLIKPVSFSLTEILKTIKGYSAKEINKLMKGKGKVWQQESFDRLVRSVQDYHFKAEYIKNNGKSIDKSDPS